MDELERKLELAVQKFHETTGLHVSDLRLSETEVTTAGDDHRTYFYRVKMEVRL
jgi:hypothetical protein